jgi:hypothetical protein
MYQHKTKRHTIIKQSIIKKYQKPILSNFGKTFNKFKVEPNIIPKNIKYSNENFLK